MTEVLGDVATTTSTSIIIIIIIIITSAAMMNCVSNLTYYSAQLLRLSCR